MQVDVDIVIISTFLVINFAVGLFYSRGKTTLREYAVGNKNFSTGTIAATVIATCIGGGFFSGAITETYKQGLYFIIPALGEPLCLIIVGYFFIPRMAEFLGDLSIADALGKLFGRYVQIITAFAGIFLCIGIVALQFKVGAAILKVFFGISGFYAILACAVIVTLYSAFGGIKAVTFTDIVQFFTFGAIVPIISLTIWGTLNDPYIVFSTLGQNPLFDYNQVFDFGNTKFINTIFLLSFFLLPGFQPVFFQRIVMAKNVIQGKNAFIIGGSICLLMLLIISWIGILLLSNDPGLDANNLLPYIISTYNYTGLKGLTAVGIMAIIMSTADSYINSSAVLFTNDVLKPLNFKRVVLPNDLTLACIFSFFVGIAGFFLALKASTILNLLLLIFSFYMPIVSVPLILAVLGFRSSSKSVLCGMCGGFIVVVIFNTLDTGIDSVIPGVIANATFLTGSHYLLRQPGGWIGIRNPEPIRLIRSERKRKLKSLIKAIYNFDFMTFCKNNSPKQDYIYSMLGLFFIVSVFSTMYSIPKDIQQENNEILEFIYHTVLVSSSILLTFPIWPSTFKNEKFIIIAWNVILPYVLIFAPTLLIIISDFGQFQLMIFMLNIIIIAMMLRWQVAIIMVCSVVFLSIESYKWYLGVDNLTAAVEIELQFKVMYVLLLITSILIVFLKPKQQHQELTEDSNIFLSAKVIDQKNELVKLQEFKNELLQNIEHEMRTPITGITSLGQVLWDNYDKFNEEQRRNATRDIAQSSERLTSLVNNLIDLSKLRNLDYNLNKSEINLSELVLKRLEICQKLYMNEKNREDLNFEVEVEDKLTAFCDEHYITRTIDNIIINAIQYCPKGQITVKLHKNSGEEIEFSVKDEGIGIPEEELYEVFGAFIVSSRTKTPAGGRGIGLALCKKVIKAHNGEIWAKQNPDKGTIFTFTLPRNNKD
ncbi:MAG: alkaline phosphatase [Rickettsiales bacterium]|nr:alkaline phosphatase [Rickettsiales bacterium]